MWSTMDIREHLPNRFPLVRKREPVNHATKDMFRLAGNGMAMRALFVSILTLLSSMSPTKLAAYLE